MPEAVISLTTSRTRKPTPLSEIEIAHARMAVAVAALRPIPIGHKIEAMEVAIRARHLRAILEEVRLYATAVVADIAAHAPVKDETTLIDDAASDILGALFVTRNRLEEAEGS